MAVSYSNMVLVGLAGTTARNLCGRPRALPFSFFIVARYNTPQNISHDGQAESSPQLLVPVMIILFHERFF
jgi:hypothetical protein